MPTADGTNIGFTKYAVGPTRVEGSSIETAFPVPSGSQWSVSLELDEDGADEFAAVTAELSCVRDGFAPVPIEPRGCVGEYDADE